MFSSVFICKVFISSKEFCHSTTGCAVQEILAHVGDPGYAAGLGQFNLIVFLIHYS